jgi:protein O-GlcNAc transferase
MSAGRLQGAIAFLQQGNLDQAREQCEQIIRLEPRHAEAWRLLGLVAMHRGELQRAAEALSRSLDAQPGQPATLTNLGVVLRGLGKPDQSVQCYERALAVQPDLPEALSNRANALSDLGRHAEAVASCDRALLLRPDYPEALSNRGNALRALARPAEALGSFDRAIELRPDFAAAYSNRAAALIDLERPEEALRDSERALALQDRFADAHNNRGNALRSLGRLDDALASFARALQLQPGYAEAHVNRGNLLLQLRGADQALASIDRGLQLKPYDAVARYSRAAALRRANRPAEALESFGHALELEPDLVAARADRAGLLLHLNRVEEAIEDFSRVVAQAPHHPFAAGHLLQCRLRLCDWTDYDTRVAELTRSIEQGLPVVAPVWCLALTDSGSLQQQCARIFSAYQLRPRPLPLPPVERRRHDRLRIAYVSSDFRDHPVARLLVRVFEQHDRERFEIFGVSLSSPEESGLGRRVAAAFDHLADASRMADTEIAALIQRFEIDLLIDLNGCTEGLRPGVLARRPAPVQASYLGYPGTSGVDFLDYVIADGFVIPEAARGFYSERVVSLPGCFQANDDRRQAAPRKPTRREAGLPEEGMVLGCFSHSAKLTPSLFSVWARLLHVREDCVLWLVADDARARHNLQAEARRRGIESARLVFAPRLSYPEHLARLPLTDLAVDTFPFNGGATTSDVLWAGVPVLTCCGEAFASRMTGSLLQALELPELIACSVEEYERAGLALLREPERLATLRSRLARNLRSATVFDTARTCGELEAVYTEICKRHTSV